MRPALACLALLRAAAADVGARAPAVAAGRRRVLRERWLVNMTNVTAAPAILIPVRRTHKRRHDRCVGNLLELEGFPRAARRPRGDLIKASPGSRRGGLVDASLPAAAPRRLVGTQAAGVFFLVDGASRPLVEAGSQKLREGGFGRVELVADGEEDELLEARRRHEPGLQP